MLYSVYRTVFGVTGSGVGALIPGGAPWFAFCSPYGRSSLCGRLRWVHFWIRLVEFLGMISMVTSKVQTNGLGLSKIETGILSGLILLTAQRCPGWLQVFFRAGEFEVVYVDCQQHSGVRVPETRAPFKAFPKRLESGFGDVFFTVLFPEAPRVWVAV